jgi:hypothetical protein
MRVYKILQVSDLIILSSYDIIKLCKQKEMKKYLYKFRYYSTRMSKNKINQSTEYYLGESWLVVCSFS